MVKSLLLVTLFAIPSFSFGMTQADIDAQKAEWRAEEDKERSEVREINERGAEKSAETEKEYYQDSVDAYDREVTEKWESDAMKDEDRFHDRTDNSTSSNDSSSDDKGCVIQ